MSQIRDMIDAIEIENFDVARDVLKTSLAQYMAGKKYLSNKEVFGGCNINPNEEEAQMKSELVDS